MASVGVDQKLLQAVADAAKAGTQSKLKRKTPEAPIMPKEEVESPAKKGRQQPAVAKAKTKAGKEAETAEEKPKAGKAGATAGEASKKDGDVSKGAKGQGICDASRAAGLEQVRNQQKQLMAFKRSREGADPDKTGDKRKCPMWLRECMPPAKSAKFKHWFQIWVQCEGNWGKVMLTEILIRKQTKKSTKGWEWLMKSEVQARNSPAAAEALLSACTDNPAWNKKHFQIRECPDAHKYYILTSEVTEEIEEHSAEQQLKIMMEVDGDLPKELAASLPGSATSDWDPTGSSHPTTSPTKAIEDDPEAKQKAEAAAAKVVAAAKKKTENAERAKEKKKLPETHAIKYLKGLATDISQAFEAQTKAKKSNVTASFKAEFEATFKKHVKSLNAMRKTVERCTASGTITWAILKSAKEAVHEFHRDREVLDKTIGVYDKERKLPKKKKKAEKEDDEDVDDDNE